MNVPAGQLAAGDVASGLQTISWYVIRAAQEPIIRFIWLGYYGPKSYTLDEI